MSSLDQVRKMLPTISIALIFVLTRLGAEAVILEASRGVIKPMSLSMDEKPCADITDNDLSPYSEGDFVSKKSASKASKGLDGFLNSKGDKRSKPKACKHDLMIDLAKKDTVTSPQTEDSSASKQPLDRWSDWHDMSIDPDLSSSENQQRRSSGSNVQLLYHNPYAQIPFQVARSNSFMSVYPPPMPPVLHHVFPMPQFHYQPLTRRAMIDIYQPTSSRILVPQRANLVSQRPLRPVAPQAPAAISSPTVVLNSTTSRAPPRILKRRRIKTLLPVGLSSWLLGGIRDLDARHWKLPKEIIDKLTINDVDLQHSEFTGPVVQPNVFLNTNNQVQPGGSLERPDQPRPNVVPVVPKISLPPR